MYAFTGPGSAKTSGGKHCLPHHRIAASLTHQQAARCPARGMPTGEWHVAMCQSHCSSIPVLLLQGHLQTFAHQCHRTDHDPFVSATPCGRSTPAIHCTSNGAFGCFCRYQSGNLPRIFTSGLAGASVNFSQQSCRVCL